jgi:hypothetical protein
MARTDAQRYARCALDALARPYPHKLDHLIVDADDRPRPADIHPVFSGCYDWHSSVHMHWSLLRLRDRLAGDALRDEIDARFDAHFTPDRMSRECAYASHPARRGFERPYGWAWLLELQAELHAQAPRDGRVRRWAAALEPFARDIASRLASFLPECPYPVRAGTHANSAFAMILARDYSERSGDAMLRETVDAMACSWFGMDSEYPAHYEPGGADFLSPGLCEALLMSRVLGDSFADWWRAFDENDALSHWASPAVLGDMTDTQHIHLAGLNLSRAWCLRALSPRLPESQRAQAMAAADAHEQASTPFVAEGDFVGTHWLVTFALLAAEA